jgi:hypothetical protein
MTVATHTNTYVEEDVLRWRFAQLVRAGYSHDQATELACHAYVDLHQAIELPARGCPAATALRILL